MRTVLAQSSSRFLCLNQLKRESTELPLHTVQQIAAEHILAAVVAALFLAHPSLAMKNPSPSAQLSKVKFCTRPR
jgi:hypothetical protein